MPTLQESAHQLMDLFAAQGEEMRLVGGAVRDALLGLPVREIDLATTSVPTRTLEILAAAHIKAVPTGLAHGTITAVIEGQPFEITSLREDVATDGRHATVRFARDWRQDAARRDFTFNALSRDPQGTLHDYFSGEQDLRAGCVRFVGEAAARLQEDHLRLLRYFRFSAWYGKQPPETTTLTALRADVPNLATLSRERVWKEWKKLLAAPQPLPALKLMDEIGLLQKLSPKIDWAALTALLQTEQAAAKTGWPVATPWQGLRRLAALSAGAAPAGGWQNRFALGNREAEILAHFAAFTAPGTQAAASASPRVLAYMYGIDLTQEFLLLQNRHNAHFDWENAAAVLHHWQPVKLPVTGQDLAELGVPPGPETGRLLRETEQWWLAADFQPDRAACLAYLRSRLPASR